MKSSTVAASAAVKSVGSSRLYDVPSLENDRMNFQMWKFRVRMVLGIQGLWNIVSGDEAQPDEMTHPIKSEEWLLKDQEAHTQITLTLKDKPLSGVLYTTTSAEAWRKLSERYEGKGKQSIAYLISELFHSTLSDDESMETQLNSMRQKANVLKTLGQPLEDSLIAIAMVISLPPSYSTLQTILMAANDKLTTDTVINQVLIEEKSRKVSSTLLALATKTTGRPKGKGKEKGVKEDKGKKSCTYCSRNGHTEDECWKKAAERSKEKDDASKEKTDEKKELAAHVVKAGLTHSPPLRLFMAQRLASTPTQRDWIIDSGTSAHMCSERDLFDSYRPLWPPQLIGLGDGRTIPATGTGDIHLLVYIGDSRRRVLTLCDVCHVPVLDKNLLSVSCLARHNLQVIFGMRSCQITDSQETIRTAYKKDALYILSTARRLDEATYAKKAPPQSEDPCPLHTMYLNVCGPVDTATRTGDYYFATFVNTYSHHVVVRLMKSKGEISKFTQEYLDHAETVTGEHAAHFRTADIGNRTFDALQAYLNTKGISCGVANKHAPGIESAAAQTASRLLETCMPPIP